MEDPKTTVDIARITDLTLLRPEATLPDLRKLCYDAHDSGCYSVCVSPWYVERAIDTLRGPGDTPGSAVKVITVVGFPLGTNAIDTKAFETARAIEDGAAEIDMVMNLGAFLSRRYTYVQADIRAVVAAAGAVPVKVIIESAALLLDDVRRASETAAFCGAAFVKSSTGFHPKGGATVEAIAAMRAAVGPDIGVKASGGLKKREQVLAMIAAGASRVGASSKDIF
ncbi:MAG: Deoxyribose-phosphate aldolase 2 [Candidatus Parcubacteria bacterium]